MRKFYLLAAVALVSGMVAMAGDAAETVRIPLLNGIYSVEAPGDWYMEQSPDGESAYFATAMGADSMLVFSAPNPTIEGDIEAYAEKQREVLFKTMGGGEIIRQDKKEFKGYPAIFAHVSVPGGQGLMNVFDVDGAAVLCLVLSPDGEFDEFIGDAIEIIDSYEIDEGVLEDNMDLLKELGEKINATISEQLD
jgi:hypothetical protein